MKSDPIHVHDNSKKTVFQIKDIDIQEMEDRYYN